MSRWRIEWEDFLYYTRRKVDQFVCGLTGHIWIELENVDMCTYCGKIRGKKND